MNKRWYVLILVVVLVLLWLWLKPDSEVERHFKGIIENESNQETIEHMRMEKDMTAPYLEEGGIGGSGNSDPCNGVQDPEKPCNPAQ